MGRAARRFLRAVDSKAVKDSVVFRIACGQSTAVTSATPPVWSADTGYSGGTPVTTNVPIDVSGVEHPAPASIY